MNNFDYKAHNAEVKEVWESYHRGQPIRIPMILGLSSRYFMFNEATNPKNISYKEYTENPDLMFELQVRFEHFRRMNIPADHEMGLPEEGWTVMIDFQNYFDAVWLGGHLRYIDGNVPCSEPFLTDDNKNMLFEKGFPDAFSGLMERGRNYYEYFQEKAKSYSFEGVKVNSIFPAFLYTDGPFTVACNIRGTTEFCIDLYEDPDYAHSLLSYITDASIYRLTEWRKYMGLPVIQDSFGFADDSILLLSKDMYKEFVLPYHKKLIDALTNNKKGNAIHLCGDATRHYKTISEEINVRNFDTGFPVKHGELVKELGPEVAIQGGPHVELLKSGSELEIENEVKRIIEEVKGHSKKFILRDGNNVAPHTPIKNIEAMYRACKKYGYY